MESRFWLFAYVISGGAVLFAGGYYLGLSGAADTKIESPKIVSDRNKKELKKELQQPEIKALSDPSASKMVFDSNINESNNPLEERRQGGIREILDQFVNQTNPVYSTAPCPKL